MPPRPRRMKVRTLFKIVVQGVLDGELCSGCYFIWASTPKQAQELVMSFRRKQKVKIVDTESYDTHTSEIDTEAMPRNERLARKGY
jgi:hypothetical protein